MLILLLLSLLLALLLLLFLLQSESGIQLHSKDFVDPTVVFDDPCEWGQGRGQRRGEGGSRGEGGVGRWIAERQVDRVQGYCWL
jgi:hypothetical protein